jgi:hypothetical protein
LPEAFSSIADMRIVIDSATDKLEAGLASTQDLIKRFASEGNDSLSLLDRALGKTGDTAGNAGGLLKSLLNDVVGKGTADGVEAIATKLTGLIGKANELGAFIQGTVMVANAAGGYVASQTGTEDQWAEVQKSAQGLNDALVGGLWVGLDETKDKLLATGASVLGFQYDMENAAAATKTETIGAFAALKQALDDLKYGFETTFVPEKYQSLETLEETVSCERLQRGLISTETPPHRRGLCRLLRRSKRVSRRSAAAKPGPWISMRRLVKQTSRTDDKHALIWAFQLSGSLALAKVRLTTPHREDCPPII